VDPGALGNPSRTARGLARTSRSDAEIVGKALVVMDGLYAELKARAAAGTP
jgi:hypothetical protein